MFIFSTRLNGEGENAKSVSWLQRAVKSRSALESFKNTEGGEPHLPQATFPPVSELLPRVRYLAITASSE